MLYRYENALGFSCWRIKGKREELTPAEDVNETKKNLCKSSGQKDTAVARNHSTNATMY